MSTTMQQQQDQQPQFFQQQQQTQQQDDKIWVQKSGGLGDLQFLGDVVVRRIEVNRAEEINALNRRLAEAEQKVLEAERVRKDEAILAAESRKLAERSREHAQQASSLVREHEGFKLQALEQERQFERQRFEAHTQAVNAENARANAKAEEVLYFEQEKEALQLVNKHELAAEHALKIERAYELVKQECERRRWMLQSDTDIQVEGKLPAETPAMAQIRVEVQPQAIPEPFRAAPAVPQPSAKLAEVVEHIPQHAPIHVELPPLATKSMREEVQTIRVSREEAIMNTGNTRVTRNI